MLSITAAEVDLLAAAVVRAARLLASRQSWRALDVLVDCLGQIPAVATGVDLAELRRALHGIDDRLAAAGHDEGGEER